MPVHWSGLTGPKVLGAAAAIFDKWKSRPEAKAGAETVEPFAEIETRLAAFMQTLQALEEDKTAQELVVRELSEQIKKLDQTTASQAALTQSMVKKIQALEEAEAGKAEVIDTIAKQVQGIAAGLSKLEKKTGLMLLLAGAALIASAGALIVSVMR